MDHRDSLNSDRCLDISRAPKKGSARELGGSCANSCKRTCLKTNCQTENGFIRGNQTNKDYKTRILKLP